MAELRIASNLSLGLDAVTKTFAILAQRRKGKTYTASVIAEEFVKAGQPWVALDPTGAWWGLRAGADGSTKVGLPVYVFGGQHGDLPLERTAGKVIEAKAEDPVELRKQIRELERRLTDRPEAEPVEVSVEVPVFPPELKTRVKELLEGVGDQAGSVAETAGNLLHLVESDFDMQGIKPLLKPVARPASPPRPSPRSTPTPARDGDIKLAKAARTILGVLVERSPMELTRAQVSTLSGYRPKSSTFANALSELRTTGMMVGSQTMSATAEGIALLGDGRPTPRTPEEVQAQWLGALPQAPRRILEDLIDLFPTAIDRESIASATGYSITSSTFANALSTLRTSGLLTDEPGKELRASEALFEVGG